MASTPPAVLSFVGNWFLRSEKQFDLTFAEQELIVAAMGNQPRRWDGSPDIAKMQDVLSLNPSVVRRIGSRLLTVITGMRGCGSAVKVLLDHGVSLDIDAESYNVLHEAAWANAYDTLAAVFESGACDATCVSVRKPHTGWPDNISLMYWVAWGGHPELAQLLINYGVGIHHELKIKGNGERGETSLQEAVSPGFAGGIRGSEDGKREVAKVLIADGVSYDICSACALDDVHRLREILGADESQANAVAVYGMVPLHWAARAGSMACAKELLQHGVDLNVRNKSFRTPLQLAAEQDQAEIIALLAASGADLNTQDRKGRTPLHRAAYEGKRNAAEALMAAGADTTVKNKRGKTAFEIARTECKYLKNRVH